MGEEAQKSCFLSCGEGMAAPLCHSGADASHALGTQTTWNGAGEGHEVWSRGPGSKTPPLQPTRRETVSCHLLLHPSTK